MRTQALTRVDDLVLEEADDRRPCRVIRPQLGSKRVKVSSKVFVERTYDAFITPVTDLDSSTDARGQDDV